MPGVELQINTFTVLCCLSSQQSKKHGTLLVWNALKRLGHTDYDTHSQSRREYIATSPNILFLHNKSLIYDVSIEATAIYHILNAMFLTWLFVALVLKALDFTVCWTWVEKSTLSGLDAKIYFCRDQSWVCIWEDPCITSAPCIAHIHRESFVGFQEARSWTA